MQGIIIESISNLYKIAIRKDKNNEIDKKSKDNDSQKLPGGGIKTLGQENPHDQ